MRSTDRTVLHRRFRWVATAHGQIGTIADSEGWAIRCPLVTFPRECMPIAEGMRWSCPRPNPISSRPNVGSASDGIFHPAGTQRQMCVGARRTAAPGAQSNLAASARHATALSSSSDSQTERSVGQGMVAGAVLDAVADWYWLRPVSRGGHADRATLTTSGIAP